MRGIKKDAEALYSCGTVNDLSFQPTQRNTTHNLYLLSSSLSTGISGATLFH